MALMHDSDHFDLCICIWICICICILIYNGYTYIHTISLFTYRCIYSVECVYAHTHTYIFIHMHIRTRIYIYMQHIKLCKYMLLIDMPTQLHARFGGTKIKPTSFQEPATSPGRRWGFGRNWTAGGATSALCTHCTPLYSGKWWSTGKSCL